MIYDMVWYMIYGMVHDMIWYGMIYGIV